MSASDDLDELAGRISENLARGGIKLRPIEVLICPFCREPWDTHVVSASSRWWNEAYARLDVHEPPTEMPDPPAEFDVDLRDCVSALKIRNRGPVGPPGAMGAAGRDGRDATPPAQPPYDPITEGQMDW